MDSENILLINSNRMKPPIGPLALDYVAPSLRQRGFKPVLIDLSFDPDWLKSLDATLNGGVMAVGISVRNVDDSYMSSSEFFLPHIQLMVKEIRSRTTAPIILGGVGFSIMAQAALKYCGADFGIAGDGEHSLPALLRRIAEGKEPLGVPGVLVNTGEGIAVTPPAYPDITTEPFPNRDFIDNYRYFVEGGQAGIETKRGCSGQCIYCADPLSKGRTVRLRKPDIIVQEMKNLLEQGVNCFHFCDSEFNIPLAHAKDVCRAIIERGLADSLTWYCYASPAPLDEESVRLLKRAGCVGINFGADHTVDRMLRVLGRSYASKDIASAAELCKREGLTVMFDMLFGAPGETRDTIEEAIRFMKSIDPDCVGVSAGVRIYPGTSLAQRIAAAKDVSALGTLSGDVEDEDFLKPTYFVSAGLHDEIHDIIAESVKDDPRFFVGSKEQVDSNYNYNDNTELAQAIRNGARGAYWDILRRIRQEA